MEAFWGIVIAAIFIAALAYLIVMGVRYLNREHAGGGRSEIDSSRHRTEDIGREKVERKEKGVYRYDSPE